MTWGAVGGAAIGGVSSIIGGKKASKNAAKQQAATLEAQRQAALQQQQWAKDNAIWANDQNIANAGTEYEKNWESADRALGDNRAGQSSDFGDLSWKQDPTTGEWQQSIGINEADRGTLDALRSGREGALGGLDSEFQMNNSVYDARKANMDQDLATRRAAQEAKYAAMGMNTGSGQAWLNGQRALGDTESRAQNDLISGSVTDWNTEQSNLRSNLGTYENMMTGLENRTGMPTYATVNTPPAYNIPTVNAPGTPTYDPTAAIKAGQVAGAGTQAGWDSLGTGLGKLGESAWNSWNKPTTGTPTSDAAMADTSWWGGK